MLPGTSRSMTKISTDIPNSVSDHQQEAADEIGSHSRLSLSPLRRAPRYLSSQTSSKRQPL